jgi:heme/copper-type cytochrome/quinol oxidase subunit 2
MAEFPPAGDAAISQPTTEISVPNSSMLSVTSLALATVAMAVFWSVELAAGSGIGTAHGVVYPVAAVAGLILGVIAVATGVVARRRVKRGNAARGGVAIAGIVLGVVAIVVPAILLAYLAYLGYSGYEDFQSCVRGAGTAYPSYLCLKGCPSFLDSLCRRQIGW